MQALSGFARKYAIMGELDPGFGTGSTPEAFVRLDMWEGRMMASVHIKGLKQGPYQYWLYLIFSKGDQLVALPVGVVTTAYAGMQNGLWLESEALKNSDVKPEWVKYAVITAESQDKKWIPLFSSFEKTQKWDETIRQAVMKQQTVKEPVRENIRPEIVQHKAAQQEYVIAEPAKTETQANEQAHMRSDKGPKVTEMLRPETRPAAEVRPAPEVKPEQQPPKPVQEAKSAGKCDPGKLETLLANNFEGCNPFKGGNKGYTWYQVTDLAKLSNIMYLTGLNVPIFANPKILVGLFRYKHILAGFYKGEHYPSYFVIGVPARDDKDNRPFDNACRWVNATDPSIRDMGGYWLVYVSMKSGEIVV